MTGKFGFTRSIQERLDALTKKWWLYLLLFIPVFIQPYATKGYHPTQTIDVIMQSLSKPFIYAIPILFPIAKLVPISLVAGIMIFGNRLKNLFNAYVALLFLGIAVFQNAGQTETYGLVVTTGNLILVLIVALAWIWEVVAQQNDFEPRKHSLGRWWIVPLAILALWSPITSNTLKPDFSLARLLTSESGLTNCMMLPVFLSVLILYYPTVNLTTMRVMGFVGIYFGLVNLLVWFLMYPSGWWMGVLHIPLIVISAFGFGLGIRAKK